MSVALLTLTMRSHSSVCFFVLSGSVVHAHVPGLLDSSCEPLMESQMASG